MKKYIISALLASAVSILYADNAPMFSLPGGNLMPINNEDIRLVSETIDFYLYPNHIGYDVEINYNFYNEGKTQKIQLGFPTDSIREIYSDFVCTVNGKEVKVERKTGQWTFLQNIMVATFLIFMIQIKNCIMEEMRLMCLLPHSKATIQQKSKTHIIPNTNVIKTAKICFSGIF